MIKQNKKEKATTKTLNLSEQLEVMKASFNKRPMPSLEDRINKLNMLKNALLFFKSEMFTALNKDFGHRSEQDTILEFLPSISNIDYTINQLESWMQPSKRHAGLLLEATSEVEVMYQPKGVVGIISTWNAPIMVTINPLIAAIATGNLAMIKMSEFTPAFNRVLKEILATVFAENEVCIIEGEADVAAAFSGLPFDHILFTGSTTVGKLVMKAAANNLTPVTLELGGKSPVLVDNTVQMEQVVERIIVGKSANNGQLCIAPDYVWLPENRLSDFIEEYKKQYAILNEKGVDSESLTSVANDRQFTRIQNILTDAEYKSDLILSTHDNAIDKDKNRIVTHLIINPDNDSIAMTEEMFGPILPIKTYKNIEEAFDFILNRPRPLAFYLMSNDEALQNRVKHETHSGALCINDAIFHAAVDDAPFGGIGDSGMGNYHGIEGFITFSHAKTVLKTGEQSVVKQLFLPGETPLKTKIEQLLNF